MLFGVAHVSDDAQKLAKAVSSKLPHADVKVQLDYFPSRREKLLSTLIFKIYFRLLCFCVHVFTCNICNANGKCNLKRLKFKPTKPRRAISDIHYDFSKE